MKEEIIQYLKREPRFRERKSKWRGIADLLIKRYNLDIDRKILADIIADGSNADRCWRDILKNDISLRGADYSDGEILAQEKQIQLGYTPNFHKDIQQLKLISN